MVKKTGPDSTLRDTKDRKPYDKPTLTKGPVLSDVTAVQAKSLVVTDT